MTEAIGRCGHCLFFNFCKRLFFLILRGSSLAKCDENLWSYDSVALHTAGSCIGFRFRIS